MPFVLNLFLYLKLGIMKESVMIKKIPVLIRIMVTEKFMKMFQNCAFCAILQLWNVFANCTVTIIQIDTGIFYCFPFSNAVLLDTINKISVKKNILTLRGAPAFSRTPEQGGSRTFSSSKTYSVCSKYIGAPIKEDSRSKTCKNVNKAPL